MVNLKNPSMAEFSSIVHIVQYFRVQDNVLQCSKSLCILQNSLFGLSLFFGWSRVHALIKFFMACLSMLVLDVKQDT